MLLLAQTVVFDEKRGPGMRSPTGKNFERITLLMFFHFVLYVFIARIKFLQKFQQGAIPTVIGCILAASVLFGTTVVTNAQSALLFAGLFLLALRWKWPSWGLIAAGGLGSLLLHRF